MLLADVGKKGESSMREAFVLKFKDGAEHLVSKVYLKFQDDETGEPKARYFSVAQLRRARRSPRWVNWVLSYQGWDISDFTISQGYTGNITFNINRGVLVKPMDQRKPGRVENREFHDALVLRVGGQS